MKDVYFKDINLSFNCFQNLLLKKIPTQNQWRENAVKYMNHFNTFQTNGKIDNDFDTGMKIDSIYLKEKNFH